MGNNKVIYTFENIYGDKIPDEKFAKQIENEYMIALVMSDISEQLFWLMFSLNPADTNKVVEALKHMRKILKEKTENVQTEKPIVCEPVEGEKGKIMCLIDEEAAKIFPPDRIEALHQLIGIIKDIVDAFVEVFIDDKKEGALRLPKGDT